jgi:hypothetical protein
MFRFTIRDVLWATVVAALLVCLSLQWLASRRQAQDAAQKLRDQLIKAKELEGQLNTAKARNRLYRLTLQGANVSVPVANPDNP